MTVQCVHDLSVLNSNPWVFSLGRCKKWVQNCRREDLRNKSTEYLYKNVYLCSRHFETSQYNTSGKYLLRTAVPTLFDVPNPPATLATKRVLHERQDPLAKKAKKGEFSMMNAGRYIVLTVPLLVTCNSVVQFKY